MPYAKQTLKKYLNDLAARIPAPGGGSAAAMSGAMGAALLSMVVNFTLGKPKYAAFEKDLKKILIKSENARKKFLALLDADIAAYRLKNKAHSLSVPFEAAKLSAQVILLCRPLAKKGNINLISDVASAASLLESAFVAACFNVEINLKDPAHHRVAASIRRQLLQLSKTVKKERRNTEESFGQIIRR